MNNDNPEWYVVQTPKETAYDSPYGKCPDCGGSLSAVWFEEEEIKRGEYTGRVRRAVSHLVCTKCFQNIVVDDTFDGKWHY